MKKCLIVAYVCLCLICIITGCGGGNPDPPAETPEPTLSPSADNLIHNSNFEKDIFGNDTEESGWGNWGCGSIVPEPKYTFERRLDSESSNHYLYFTSSDCGTEEWDYLIMPLKDTTPFYVQLKSGKEYFISLTVKSSKTGRIYATLNDSANLKVHYGGYEIITTETLKTYTAFIMVGNDKEVRFALSLGNKKDGAIKNDNVEFYIDDVQLLEQ